VYASKSQIHPKFKAKVYLKKAIYMYQPYYDSIGLKEFAILDNVDNIIHA